MGTGEGAAVAAEVSPCPFIPATVVGVVTTEADVVAAAAAALEVVEVEVGEAVLDPAHSLVQIAYETLLFQRLLFPL